MTITGFKGSDQNDVSATRANELKVCKTSVRVEQKWEVKSESPKPHNVPLSCASDANESLAAASGIYKLFKKWLTILRSPPSNQGVEEILGEPPPGDLPETSQGMQQTVKYRTLKVAWSTFQALDATIKIPLLILWVWQFVYFCILSMVSDFPYITYVHYTWELGKRIEFIPYCSMFIFFYEHMHVMLLKCSS